MDDSESMQALADSLPDLSPAIESQLWEFIERAGTMDEEEYLHSLQGKPPMIGDQPLTLALLGQLYVTSRLNTISKPKPPKLPSLVSMAVGKMIETLSTTSNLQADVETIVASVSTTVLSRLIHDLRLPYDVLRAFDKVINTPESGHAAFDIDQVLLDIENSLRSHPGSCPSNYLVTSDDLVDLLEPGEFQKRIHLFENNFHTLTGHLFQQLNWSNLLAGPSITRRALSNTNPVVQIDFWIYGLSPHEANAKIEQIYDLWISLVPDPDEISIVKYPNDVHLRRLDSNHVIRIHLHLNPSIASTLLHISSPNAEEKFPFPMCYDGTKIFFLPRTARSCEKALKALTTFDPTAVQTPDSVDYISQIDAMSNDQIFTNLRAIITRTLHLATPPPSSSFRGYLSRRIRISAMTSTLIPYLTRTQLCTPILIPTALLTFLHSLSLPAKTTTTTSPSTAPPTTDLTTPPPPIPTPSTDLTTSFPSTTTPLATDLTKSLISIHNPTTYRNPRPTLPTFPPTPFTPIPPLTDTNSPDGDLRYLLLTSRTMWTGWNPALDIVMTLLAALAARFWNEQLSFSSPVDPDSADAVFSLASALARRRVGRLGREGRWS